jgi:hypothetical protein
MSTHEIFLLILLTSVAGMFVGSTLAYYDAYGLRHPLLPSNQTLPLPCNPKYPDPLNCGIQPWMKIPCENLNGAPGLCCNITSWAPNDCD